MKKNIEKILALSLISSMTFANLSFAEQQDLIKKSETVYVTVEGNEIKDKSVSVWLNSDKNIKANDKSNLTNVKDLKTDKMLKSENGYLKLDENKKDIYYKGDTDKKLPVDVSVKYSSAVGPRQNSRLFLSLSLNISGPNVFHLPDSSQISRG